MTIHLGIAAQMANIFEIKCFYKSLIYLNTDQ